MKKSIAILIAVLLTATVWAQAPQKMSYQAVIRAASNNLITSHAVGMRISILQGTTPVYVETQTTSTNANGLVSVEIGNGTFVSGVVFSAIDWSTGTYFIKTETDPAGGTNYTAIVGTSQLLSVPYALNAKTAESITGTITETDPIYTSSQAANITANDITKVSNLSGVNTGDQDLSGLATTTSLNLKVDKVTGKGLSTNDYTTAEQTKLAAITGDQDLSGLATTSAVTTSLNLKVDKEAGKGLSTEDYTTAEQAKVSNLSGINTGDQDLGGLATTSAVTTSLNLKVDKVTGKGLSTNDYTTAEQTKLAAITGTNTGDQDLSSLATTSAITTSLNLKVDKVAGKDLSTNDYSTLEKTKLAAITGTNTGDQDLGGLATITSLNLKVDKVTGKGLSTNDYTTAEQTKLAAITGTNTGDNATNTQYSGLDAAKANLSGATFTGAISATNLSGSNTGDQTLPTLVSLNAIASNTDITAGTNTKITYDAKGLVTAGAAATTADIAAATDKNYVTDAQQTAITHTNRASLDLVSGTNTGDNATNTQYSGLDAAKANLSGATFTGAISATNLSGSNTGDQTLPTLVSLNAVASNTDITAGTNTKITYDAKGLVTAGAAATTADIAAATDKNYVTDAQQTAITHTNRASLDLVSGTNTGDNATNTQYSGLDAAKANLSGATFTGAISATNLSGTNTGDQTNITGNAATVTTNANLTGDVTSSGNATTLSSTAVTAATYGSATQVPVFAVDAKGRVTGVTNTTITGTSPVGSALTSANILVGSATNVAAAVVMSGDVTITNAGATAIASGVIVNADVNAAAAIEDTKLATIATAGKVSNSATTATNANTASAIVARDASGNFSAGTITAALTGDVTGNTSGTAANVSGIVLGANGGTGIANTGKTITLGGDLTISGATTTLTTTAPTTVTLPTTGTLATLGNAESITGLKTFTKDKIALLGTSTGVTTLSTANASATPYTITLPAATGTVALTSDITSRWALAGNAGTVDGTNFIGTTDDVPFNVKVNGENAGRIDGTLSNTFWGYQAGNLTTGVSNTAIGVDALYLNTTGTDNTAIGVAALFSNTIGTFNTAIGRSALYSNTGTYNTAIGQYALNTNITGTYNTAIGYGADVNSTALTNTTAIGFGTCVNVSNTVQIGNSAVTDVYFGNGTTTVLHGNFGTTTSWSLTGNAGTVDGTNFIGTTDNKPFNIRVNGVKAGRIDPAGNSFFGSQAGNSTTGIFNTAMGSFALISNVGGVENTANGYSALFANISGNYNTANGGSALASNTTGSNNTAIGHGADVSSGNLINATAIGYNAKVATNNSLVLGSGANVGIGTSSPSVKLDVVGSIQFTGVLKLYDGNSGASGQVLTSGGTNPPTWTTPNSGWALTGNANTIDGSNFIGTTDDKPFNVRVNNQKAGRIDKALANTFWGYQAGNVNTTGHNNTASGYQALNSNVGGTDNTAIGDQALFYNTTGSNNTANGSQALAINAVGSNNTADGYQALYFNTAGNYNTAIGESALYSNTTGNYNTTNGVNALLANTTGSNNTAIGYGANVGSAALSNATAIGNSAIVNASNNVQIGNSAVTDVYFGDGTTTVLHGKINVDGSETKVTAGTNITVTGTGTSGTPYVINAPAHAIGDSYQGGKIFWLDASGQHGLIAATSNQSEGIAWNNGSYTTTNAVRDGISAGMYNTERIIANQGVGSYAAQICANYQGGNYGDWYLPSKYELYLLYIQRIAVGNLPDGWYWSSTEFNGNDAVIMFLSTGTQDHAGKGFPQPVRAIRAF